MPLGDGGSAAEHLPLQVWSTSSNPQYFSTSHERQHRRGYQQRSREDGSLLGTTWAVAPINSSGPSTHPGRLLTI